MTTGPTVGLTRFIFLPCKIINVDVIVVVVIQDGGIARHNCCTDISYHYQ